MKISIVTATYNSARTLHDTIYSISCQDYPHIEYIIVDGGSNDGTLEIIKEWTEKFPIKWISEPDKGIYDAMNKGIKMSSGDVVGILNSDDYYHDCQAITQVATAFNKKKVQSIFADLSFVNPKNLNKCVRFYSSKKFKPYKFRFGYMPAHPTFFTYKKNFEIFGYYKTEYKIAADFELLMRFLLIHKISYCYIPINLVTMRTGGMSTSSFNSKMLINKEFLSACKSNGVYTNILFLYFRYLTKVFQLRFRLLTSN